MKFRVVDLLRCPRCGGAINLTDADFAQVSSSTEVASVVCHEICAFRSRSPSEVTSRDCTECYGHEVASGNLRCGCGAHYPIVRGIPRFLSEALDADIAKTQSTFSLEWKMFRFGERNWGQDIEFRKGLFLKAFGFSSDELSNKLILDAGCGSGLLSIEMARSFGMEVLALDLASGIENAYEFNYNSFVHFIQGSVLELPFRRAFDCLYCAGVLVALPDSREGFRSIVKTLRRHGRCFIWVYHPIDRKYHPDDYRKLQIYDFVRRRITSRLPIQIQYLVYLSLIPLFLIKQEIDVLLGKKGERLKWREKMQSLVDFFSPVYQNRHTPEEVVEWFREEGFEAIEVAYRERYGFGVRGDLASPRGSVAQEDHDALYETAESRPRNR